MSFVIKIVLLACVLAAAAKPLTREEEEAMIAELIGKCKSAEGASDSDVQEAMAHIPPTTRPGQCFNACIMESLGLMVGGKISVEGGVKMAERSGDPTKVKNSESVGKECQSVGGGDRCDSALAIMQCVAEVSAKLGIDPSKDLH
ncbi:general odorant-binding protein 28a-like [Bradysia coprophila]|uniref:general odorant-binding protein 28a-like n=1 Tax=Bradysia coprophila TaxID=38358 RepID=UPI00187D9E56|nr:general odorant-binding protein 28a-like [Bradysia coprophila]